MKRWIVVGAVAAVVVACGSDAASEFARDAGEMLADAGAWLTDAGTQGGSDAQAQTPATRTEVREVECSTMYEWTETSGGTKNRQARLYAELNVDTAGLAGVTVVRCGWRENEYVVTCPAGSTCTGNIDPRPHDCDTGMGVQIGNGKLRTLCGFGTASGDAPIEWAYRWTRARFALYR